MSEFVQCWHCKHYMWSFDNGDNSYAICWVKNRCVYAKENVCEDFILDKWIITKKSIPDYCTHYNAEKRT